MNVLPFELVPGPYGRGPNVPLPISLGATAFWRADQGITLNGSKVASWADLTGNGHTLSHGTDAERPTFVASDALANNRPGVSFDATATQRLRTAGPPQTTQTYTLYVVCRWLTTPLGVPAWANSGTVIQLSNDGETVGYALGGDGSGNRQGYHPGVAAVPVGVGTTDTEVWIDSCDAATVWSIDVNGVQVHAGGAFGPNAPDGASKVTMAAQASGVNFPGNVVIYEAALFDVRLSAPNRAALAGAAVARYGIV